MSQQKGYLIIADISGYTAFLTQTELEHSQGILESLFQNLLEQMRPPLPFLNWKETPFSPTRRMAVLCKGRPCLKQSRTSIAYLP